jgi:hypothetical protein
METMKWIDNLAAQARGETIPEIRVAVPRVQPVVYRLPKFVLSLSAAGSLAAACLLLVMGLHAQQAISSTSTVKSTDNTTETVLFSPLKMGVN